MALVLRNIYRPYINYPGKKNEKHKHFLVIFHNKIYECIS